MGTDTPESLPETWKDEIRDIVRGVLGKVNDDTATRTAGRRVVDQRLDADSAIEAKIQEGIEKLRTREEAERQRAEHDNRLKTVEEKVKEKTPVERRAVHRFMNWGEPD